MDIVLKEREGKGFAAARKDDNRAGLMTYSVAASDLIIIDHTEVDPAYRGEGVGQKMLYKIVEMAREKNAKIIPLCPFAASMFKKLDTLKDVLK